MSVTDKVLKLIESELKPELKVAAETVEERIYLAIVNDLPAGCVPEEVAEAGRKLYEQLAIAWADELPTATMTTDEYTRLIADSIKYNFRTSATVEQITDDFADRGFYSITAADILTAYQSIQFDSLTTDEVVTADEHRVDDFINHVNRHIAEMPVGGYKTTEETRVVITVGERSFEFYDHAALIQSLLDGLKYLKTEL